MNQLRPWSISMTLIMLLLGSCTRAEFSQKTRTFTGTISAGAAYARPFGSGLMFVLEPAKYGWVICVMSDHRDITALTPPFHGPNPRYIEGWNFRNNRNTGPNKGDVNAPPALREIIFSPDLGTTIQGPNAHSSPTSEEVEQIRHWGSGIISIDMVHLDEPDPSHQAHILSIHFIATLKWSEDEHTSRKVLVHL